MYVDGWYDMTVIMLITKENANRILNIKHKTKYETINNLIQKIYVWSIWLIMIALRTWLPTTHIYIWRHKADSSNHDIHTNICVCVGRLVYVIAISQWIYNWFVSCCLYFRRIIIIYIPVDMVAIYNSHYTLRYRVISISTSLHDHVVIYVFITLYQ